MSPEEQIDALAGRFDLAEDEDEFCEGCGASVPSACTCDDDNDRREDDR